MHEMAVFVLTLKRLKQLNGVPSLCHYAAATKLKAFITLAILFCFVGLWIVNDDFSVASPRDSSPCVINVLLFLDFKRSKTKDCPQLHYDLIKKKIIIRFNKIDYTLYTVINIWFSFLHALLLFIRYAFATKEIIFLLISFLIFNAWQF